MASARSRAAGPGRSDRSITSAATPADRTADAAAFASAIAAGRPAAPSRPILARPSVRSAISGVRPSRADALARPSAAAMPVARGVPPPAGKAARLRLARVSERVSGKSTSARVPRKATRATRSRRI